MRHSKSGVILLTFGIQVTHPYQLSSHSQTHASVCHSIRLQELKTPSIQVNDCVALRPGQLGFLTVSYVCDIIADFVIYPLSTTLSSPGISVRNLLESSGRQVHCPSIFPLFSQCNPWLCQLVAPLASSCITIVLYHQAPDLLFFWKLLPIIPLLPQDHSLYCPVSVLTKINDSLGPKFSPKYYLLGKSLPMVLSKISTQQEYDFAVFLFELLKLGRIVSLIPFPLLDF